MILPKDLEDLQQMLGDVSSLPIAFEQEYMKWLRLKHRRKESGPLGSLLTPLCAKFGLYPPDAPEIQPNGQVNWRAVAKGSRVAVTIAETGGVVRGEFVEIGDANMVHIRLDGIQWVQEFRPHQVMLELGVPSDLNLSDQDKREITNNPTSIRANPGELPAKKLPPPRVPELEAYEAARRAEMNQPAANQPPVPKPMMRAPQHVPDPIESLDEPNTDGDGMSGAADKFPTFDQQTHGSPDRATPPRMSDESWYKLSPGDKVIVQFGEDMPDAEFVRIGPGDDQVIVRLEGEENEDFFDISDVMIKPAEEAVTA